MKIVIIDDSDEERGALKSLIAHNHPECRVFEAKDSVKGLVLVGHHKPDIVFLDLGMPEINGFAALRIIRAFDPRVYIAIVSTQSLRAKVEAALQLKASTYLLKPCDPKLVAKHIAKVCQGQNRPALASEAAEKQSASNSQVIATAAS